MGKKGCFRPFSPLYQCVFLFRVPFSFPVAIIFLLSCFCTNIYVPPSHLYLTTSFAFYFRLRPIPFDLGTHRQPTNHHPQPCLFLFYHNISSFLFFFLFYNVYPFFHPYISIPDIHSDILYLCWGIVEFFFFSPSYKKTFLMTYNYG